MVKATSESVAEVDAAVMLFEPYGELTDSELSLIQELKSKHLPTYAAVNKTDTLRQASDFDERKAFLSSLGVFEDVLPLSVHEKKGEQLLLDKLEHYTVESPHYFPDDAYTDQPEKVLVAEVVREKMLLHLFDEIPHGIAVVVERFKEREDKNIVDIDINIYCEKKSHKGIIIGKGGAMLKQIASEARLECEEFLGAKVNLQCWVKIRDSWRNDEHLLNNLGFRQ